MGFLLSLSVNSIADPRRLVNTFFDFSQLFSEELLYVQLADTVYKVVRKDAYNLKKGRSAGGPGALTSFPPPPIFETSFASAQTSRLFILHRDYHIDGFLLDDV